MAGSRKIFGGKKETRGAGDYKWGAKDEAEEQRLGKGFKKKDEEMAAEQAARNREITWGPPTHDSLIDSRARGLAGLIRKLKQERQYFSVLMVNVTVLFLIGALVVWDIHQFNERQRAIVYEIAGRNPEGKGWQEGDRQVNGLFVRTRENMKPWAFRALKEEALALPVNPQWIAEQAAREEERRQEHRERVKKAYESPYIRPDGEIDMEAYYEDMRSGRRREMPDAWRQKE